MKDGVKRIVVRKRGSKTPGTDDRNGNPKPRKSRNSSATNTSTNSGGNEFNLDGDSTPGNANLGENNANRIESERLNDSGSGGSNGRNADESATGTGAGNATGSDADNSRTQPDGQPVKLGRRGRPKGSRNSSTKTSLVLDEDINDITNIVVAIGDGAKVATGYDGFEISKEEAETFAKPAARILQRHGALAETIRSVADPLALVIAATSIGAPRIAGYQMYRRMMAGYAEPQQTETRQPQSQPTSSAPFADVSVPDLAMRFISQE